jgi:hypothetical protein
LIASEVCAPWRPAHRLLRIGLASPPIDIADLRTYDQQRVEQTISTGSIEEARRIVARLGDTVD